MDVVEEFGFNRNGEGEEDTKEVELGGGPQVVEGAIEFIDFGEEIFKVIDGQERASGANDDDIGMDGEDILGTEQLDVANDHHSKVHNATSHPERTGVPVVVDGRHFKCISGQEQQQQTLGKSLYYPQPEHSLRESLVWRAYHV